MDMQGLAKHTMLERPFDILLIGLYMYVGVQVQMPHLTVIEDDKIATSSKTRNRKVFWFIPDIAQFTSHPKNSDLNCFQIWC